MSGVDRAFGTAVEPVRRALREAAEQEAAAVLQEAARQARDLEAAARAEAAGLLSAAEAEGEAAAQAQAVRRSAQLRRQAHEVVLARRNTVRHELEQRLRAAAADLRTDPRYPELLQRLTAQCHQILGEDAIVRESPQGGVVAESGTRSLDLSLPALVALVWETAPEVRAL